MIWVDAAMVSTKVVDNKARWNWTLDVFISYAVCHEIRIADTETTIAHCVHAAIPLPAPTIMIDSDFSEKPI